METKDSMGTTKTMRACKIKSRQKWPRVKQNVASRKKTVPGVEQVQKAEKKSTVIAITDVSHSRLQTIQIQEEIHSFDVGSIAPFLRVITHCLINTKIRELQIISSSFHECFLSLAADRPDFSFRIRPRAFNGASAVRPRTEMFATFSDKTLPCEVLKAIRGLRTNSPAVRSATSDAIEEK